MDVNEDLPLREYVGFIWIGDEPGVRLSVWARSVTEASAQVAAKYGEGHVMSLHNEEDARRPRSSAEGDGPPSGGESADDDA